MLGQLLAYDADGNVIAALDYLVVRDPETGEVRGLHDFGAEEESGLEMDENIWHVEGAAGSKVWPQWLERPLDWKVETAGPAGRKRAAVIVHRQTGERRERATIDDAIAQRIVEARERGVAADLRDLVGGPGPRTP